MIFKFDVRKMKGGLVNVTVRVGQPWKDPSYAGELILDENEWEEMRRMMQEGNPGAGAPFPDVQVVRSP